MPVIVAKHIQSMPRKQSSTIKKVILAGMAGNALEWYDFTLYGHLAVILSRLYFPSADAYVSLLASFSVFAAGFIMRPLGGLVFGYIGDKFGRKSALVASILTMAIPTGVIGLLPTYAQIGIMAPIFLTVIRLLQGLSLGGGFSGSITYIIEHAPPKYRGLAGSAPLASMTIGILLGLAVVQGLTLSLSEPAFESYGWRIGFLLSFVVGIVGFYIKHFLEESPDYTDLQEQKRLDLESGQPTQSPFKEIVKNHSRSALIAIGTYLTVTVPFYTITIFMNTFMTKILHHDPQQSVIINAISVTWMTLLFPLGAWISDKTSRKIVVVWSAVAFICLTYPVFWMLSQPGWMYPLMGQMVFATILGFYLSPIPAFLVELFPVKVRFTGVAISYNISAAIFGGTTPAVAMFLIKVTESNVSLAYYIMFFAVVSLASIAFYKEPSKKKLSGMHLHDLVHSDVLDKKDVA